MENEKINLNTNENLENLSELELHKPDKKLEVINSKEIIALYEPINNLIKKLKDKIENCEYDLIIGEDSSGRIPALILNNILKDVYKKNGKESPQLLFMGGVRRFYEPEGKDILDKYEKYIHNNTSSIKKAIVITEFINFGNSILPILKSLVSNKIDYDVATCVLNDQARSDFLSEKEFDGHVYFGLTAQEVDYHSPRKTLHNFIFKREIRLSGVRRHKGDVLSRHINQYVPDSDEMEEKMDQEIINESRKDIIKISKILFEENFTE